MSKYEYEIIGSGDQKKIIVYFNGDWLYISQPSNETDSELIQDAKDANGLTVIHPVPAGTQYFYPGSGRPLKSTTTTSPPIPPPEPPTVDNTTITTTTTPTQPDIPDEPPDEDEMKAQSELDEKTSKLTDTVHKMPRITVPLPDIWEDVIKPNLMTDRQVAKKIMMTTTGIIPGIAGQPSVPKVDTKSAHMAVYGKMMYDSSGKLVDDEVKHPECVNWVLFRKNTSSLNLDNDVYPMKLKVKNIKIELQNSIKGLGIKFGELSDSLIKAAIEIGIGFAAFIDAATNIPKPQPALALSAILGIFSSIAKLQMLVLAIVPLLVPLQYLSLVFPKAGNFIRIVLGVLTPIFIIVEGIGKLGELISVIKNLISTQSAKKDEIIKSSTGAIINGKVIGIFNAPVVGASVKVGTMDPVTTDTSGSFSVTKIEIGTGTVNVNVTASGYQTTSVSTNIKPGETTTIPDILLMV